MTRRFVIAMMKHETNTFSPVPTPTERFGAHGPAFGAAARMEFQGTNTPLAAYLDLANKAGAEIVTPVAADALPSGPVSVDAYETITGVILKSIEAGCDACFLDLHGAMVTETNDDGEGVLLERIRACAPGLPIAVALDLHTNLTARMVENCTSMVGYKTYPHVDMYEAGERAGKILIRALDGECDPVMAWGTRPLMPHTLCMGTDSGPMAELVERCRAEEAAGLPAATVFGGFPIADIENAGLSCVVVADGDRAAAETLRDALLDEAWAMRADFVYRSAPLEQSVGEAKALNKGPILLIDHADNCASGGTQDTTAVLAEIIRQELDDVAVFAICDPAAVTRMIEAGVGNEVTLSLGGKVDMPAIGRIGEPLDVSGRVRHISDGEFIVRGPMYTGVRAAMGRSAVLDTGRVEIVVIEHNHEPWDLGCFRSVGIEPTHKRYLMLKSRIHYRAGFAPIAKHIVECAGVGVTSSDVTLFDFKKLRRPIYPLDGDEAFN